MAKRLTALLVKKATRPGKYHDRDGLFLRVAPGGSKQFMWRGTVRGRRVDYGLGSVRYVTLKEARARAFEYRRLSRRGLDPRVRERDAAPTFAEAADRVIEIRRAGWRPGSTSEKQWRSTLERFAMPRLGRRPVDALDTGDVMGVLTPIWNNEQARRVGQRISAVLDWAILNGYRTDNPAKTVTAALPKRDGPQEHHAALPHEEVAEALRRIQKSRNWFGTRLAIEFAILTAARSGEVRGLTWEELDLKSAVWTVPAERMKAGRQHRVPLASHALGVLAHARELSAGDGLVFRSVRGGPIHQSTPSRVLTDLGVAGTLHGFRSSFRNWCGDIERAPREVAEAALAHVVPGAEGAYARSDLLERRRPIMERWGAYCHDGA